jgi:hypothetical protein
MNAASQRDSKGVNRLTTLNGIEAMQLVTDRPRDLVVRSGQDEAGQAFVTMADCGAGLDVEKI